MLRSDKFQIGFAHYFALIVAAVAVDIVIVAIVR